jgi:hypothetical protein
MADAYRYPLTRICLRTGSLTLPLNLLGVFPDRGDIVAVDPQKDVEYPLRVEGRRVLGLGPFFAAHDLTPNDELTIRPLEDGRFAFAALARPRRPDFTRPDVVGKLLDGLVDAGLPMSESEIRDLHPELPSGFPLRQALEREPRLTLHEGRWRPRLADPARRVGGDAPQVREVHEAREVREIRHPAAPRSERPTPPDRPRPAPRSTGAPPAAGSREAIDAPAARRAAARAKASGQDAGTGSAEAQRAAGQAGAERDAKARAAAGQAAAERDAMERVAAERAAAERAEAERAAVERAATLAAAERVAAERVAAERGAADERRERERAEREEASRARAEVEAALEAQAAREAEIMALVEAEELARITGTGGATEDAEGEIQEARRRTRERLVANAEDDALASARRQRDERADRRRGEVGDDLPESFTWDQPVVRRLRFPWNRKRDETKDAGPEPLPLGGDPLKLDRLGDPRPVDRSAPTAPRVSAAPRAGLFPADVGLNSATLPPGDPAKTKRAREAFATLGYRVEGLAHGQLMLYADFGRRFERVLVHVLPDGQRLDWAALLARRREAGASHLAVVGDHRDLHRQVAPADLAKATLWSWVGLERVLELAGAMPIGPFDLEPHFERDGLFDYGLDRFERTVAKRVQERGAFSSVLERLATLKAPAVFLLEDVAGSPDVPREQALRVLERLAEAPWHLVSRIDSGEFCLRYRVHDALDQIGAYASSLRVRLPERQRDRVRGLPDGLDPIESADVPNHVAAPNAPASAAEAPAPQTTQPSAPQAAVRLFAGPGLGPEDEVDADDVDVSLVAVKRPRRRD